jgi:hypothetical protein
MTAPNRRWPRFTLRSIFGAVAIASLIVVAVIQGNRLRRLEDRVEALAMQNVAFREILRDVLRTNPPFGAPDDNTPQPRPATP